MVKIVINLQQISFTLGFHPFDTKPYLIFIPVFAVPWQ